MSMNFDLSEEHRIFWDAIASFVDKEIGPLVDEAEAKEEFPVPLFKRLGGLGYLCCRYPEEYGGAGADKISECLYMEELNRVHGIDERVSEENMITGARVLTDIVKRLCRL